MSDVAGLVANTIADGELRGLVAQFQQDADGRRVLVVDAAPVWGGDAVMEMDGGPVRVVEAASVLAARAAVVDHPDGHLVLLTERSAQELGTELMAAAWKGRPVRPTPWDGVLSLFRADRLDPELRSQRWLVDLLVRKAPARGYPQPPGRIVTARDAWRGLHRILGLPETPTGPDVLAWAASGGARDGMAGLDEDSAAGVTAHLNRDVTPAAGALIALATSGSEDPVALGLVLDALGDDPPVVPRERLLTRRLDDAWPEASASVAWRALTRDAWREADGDEQRRLAGVAEEILAESKADEVDSDVLPSGLRARIARVVVAFGRVLEDRTASLSDIDASVAALSKHESCDQARLGRVEAAVRLLRRPADATSSPGGSGLTEQVATYVQDGAYRDAALDRLATGDADPDLAAVLHRIAESTRAEQRAADQAFAAAMAAEGVGAAPTASLESARPLRIEDVLDTVVAPIAATGPVLLLVLDGLSHAVAVQLVDDLRAKGWHRLGPNGQPTPQVLSTLPSWTEDSRATLLSGQLTNGRQPVEQAGFTSRASLVDAGDGQAPVLLHRSDLKLDDGVVAAGARAQLADPAQRVVGVVFNGVDDFLSSNGQLALAEGLAGLPLLPELLAAALEGGRTVVLTSDHGHILGETTARSSSGGGERWRPADGAAADGHEVLVRGPRVRQGDGALIAAADRDHRYVNLNRRGYHGGATPAEVLCPLHVLGAADAYPDGWGPAPLTPPAWWAPDEVVPDVSVDELALAAESVGTYKAAPEAPQMGLFDEVAVAAAAGEDWVARLVASPVYASQVGVAMRPPSEEDVATVLRLAVAGGGAVSGTVLERALATTPTRLRSRLEAVRAVLTVDGYVGLRVETDGAVKIDPEVLQQQFGVDA
jgi:hypothetical protein